MKIMFLLIFLLSSCATLFKEDIRWTGKAKPSPHFSTIGSESACKLYLRRINTHTSDVRSKKCLSFEYVKLVPQVAVERFNLQKVVQGLKLEGMRFQTVYFKEDGTAIVYTYDFNPTANNGKFISDKTATSQRLETHSYIQSRRKGLTLRKEMVKELQALYEDLKTINKDKTHNNKKTIEIISTIKNTNLQISRIKKELTTYASLTKLIEKKRYVVENEVEKLEDQMPIEERVFSKLEALEIK